LRRRGGGSGRLAFPRRLRYLHEPRLVFGQIAGHLPQEPAHRLQEALRRILESGKVLQHPLLLLLGLRHRLVPRLPGLLGQRGSLPSSPLQVFLRLRLGILHYGIGALLGVDKGVLQGLLHAVILRHLGPHGLDHVDELLAAVQLAVQLVRYLVEKSIDLLLVVAPHADGVELLVVDIHRAQSHLPRLPSRLVNLRMERVYLKPAFLSILPISTSAAPASLSRMRTKSPKPFRRPSLYQPKYLASRACST
jgi:hypothetical protein